MINKTLEYLLLIIPKEHCKYTLFDVYSIICEDILHVAWYFSKSQRGVEKYEQWSKCSLLLYNKPANNGVIISYYRSPLGLYSF